MSKTCRFPCVALVWQGGENHANLRARVALLARSAQPDYPCSAGSFAREPTLSNRHEQIAICGLGNAYGRLEIHGAGRGWAATHGTVHMGHKFEVNTTCTWGGNTSSSRCSQRRPIQATYCLASQCQAREFLLRAGRPTCTGTAGEGAGRGVWAGVVGGPPFRSTRPAPEGTCACRPAR